MGSNVSRDTSLDALRAIGLLLIILAHINPPSLIFQLRNFDVPLMMFVSGAAFGISSGAGKSYFAYLFSRVKRLILPTWVFLTIFFIIYFLYTVIVGARFPFSNDTIINSYNLVSGIGYVWIIRVFLLVAIALPFYAKIQKKINNNAIYLLLLLLIYVFYEFTYYFYPQQLFANYLPWVDVVFQNVIFYILPYSVIAGLGLIISKLNKKTIFFLSITFFALVIFLAYVNNFAFTQTFKYPPRIYYLSYALFISGLLYLSTKTEAITKLFSNKILSFIGAYSLWIYLWQILFLYVWRLIPGKNNWDNFIIEYLFVLLLSIMATYLHRRLIKVLLYKINIGEFGKRLLTDSFLR